MVHMLAGHTKVDAAASVSMEWFAHDAALVAKAGRGASEFWKDAERHLKAALAIQPAASDLAYILVQVGSILTMLENSKLLILQHRTIVLHATVLLENHN